jgi:hypothetical protein
MRMTLLTFGVCAAVLSATAGCAGPDGAPVDEWVGDVCGALADWQRDIEIRQTEMMQEAAPDLGADEGRRLILVFLDRTVSRTGEMLGEIESAGQPDVEDGEAIARNLREVLTEFGPILDRERAKVDELPDDPQALAEGAQAIGSSINEEFDRIGARLEASPIDPGPEIARAFDEDPTCQGTGLD